MTTADQVTIGLQQTAEVASAILGFLLAAGFLGGTVAIRFNGRWRRIKHHRPRVTLDLQHGRDRHSWT